MNAPLEESGRCKALVRVCPESSLGRVSQPVLPESQTYTV